MSITLADLKYISPATLRSWFRGGSPTGRGRFAVVDVRDADYVGGHIKGCLHYPAATFAETLPELHQRLSDVDDVVFHCALSQVRGPSSTLKFLRSHGTPNTWVLRGGFAAWQQEYGADAVVTEGYDAEVWQY
ncbi:Rhodanese domain-containing protein [[Candida] zeylanoides]|jgi:rhodanese-related sulfurtransferase